MAAIVFEPLISAVFHVVLDRLVSSQVLDFFRGRKLDETLLLKLKTTLLQINAVADDAELKQFRDPRVKAWLDEVKDAAFDADDLLDELHAHISLCNLEAHSETPDSKVHIGSSDSGSSFDKDIESRMKRVLDNLEYLKKNNDILGLEERTRHGDRSVSPFPRLQSTSLPLDPVMYGRDGDKKIIFDWLISDAQNGDPVTVCSIVGMGGLGKTTLAQHLYNDSRLESEGGFNLKAWVCVSNDFDFLNVLRKIVGAFKGVTDNSDSPEMAQQRIRGALLDKDKKKKKFLLVLDDGWNQNQEKWEALLACLNHGAQGSKIIITTRDDKVASTVRASIIHSLQPLQDEHAWKLFAKYVFIDENEESRLNPQLKEIGMKIVNKCKGLPLALRTLGRLLSGKLSIEQWEKIRTSELWKIPENDSNIIPALLLTYHHLPSHLKRCFAYCSLFPEGYIFSKEYLIQLWKSEGFLEGPQQSKRFEELGEEYFNDLLSLSFFQKQSHRVKTLFVMHGLFNDLAKYVSGDFCFRLEDEGTRNLSKMVRHLLVDTKLFQGFKEANRLRTFIGLARNPINDLNDLMSNCKLLRVLSLPCCVNVTKLPDCLGNVKHLRYLDLSDNSIKELPASICLLYYLQILKLKGCKYLEKLPSDLHKLVSLCYLDFRGTKVRDMPAHMEKLKNLQVLSSFYVGKGSEFGIQQLAELDLQGSLSICELQNVVNPSDASAANLGSKRELVKLELGWSKRSGGHVSSSNEKEVLEKLQPAKHLEELSICDYGGTEFPYWVGDISFSNLVSLKLNHCIYCWSLPCLGVLPSLKDLSIRGLHMIEVIKADFFGSSSSSSTISFASLETLVFEDMKEWKEWECASGAFPRLRCLKIKDCPNLEKHLPNHLPCLQRLEIKDCPKLVARIPRSGRIRELVVTKCGNVKLEYCPYTLATIHIYSDYMEGLILPHYPIPTSSQCYKFLVNLTIQSKWETLKTFHLDLFPNLQYLYLGGCLNLESLSSQDEHGNPNLQLLTISNCPKFESFPSGGLRAPSLSWLHLFELENLESLPEHMDILLPTVFQLQILDCPKVKPLSGGYFPPNLQILYLSKCSKLVSGLKGAFGPNGSLVALRINEVEVESFPDEGLLPLSLETLEIKNFPNLQKLDGNNLCQLPCLKKLYLIDCPRLECLPEEGLPRSISNLSIEGNCSALLKQRCQKNGQDWPKIAGVGNVCIDGVRINNE